MGDALVAAGVLTEPEVARLLIALKLAAAQSSTLITWALSVVGGSVAAIVSTSYLRPKNPNVRLIYMLYLPGWFFLGRSVYFGDRISRHYVAARFVPDGTLRMIAREINADYIRQQHMFMLGLLTFAGWLCIFLLWWVFGEWTTTKHEQG